LVTPLVAPPLTTLTIGIPIPQMPSKGGKGGGWGGEEIAKESSLADQNQNG